MSEELSTLRIEEFCKKEENENEGLVKLVDRIVKIYPLSFPTDRNEAMQKRFLKQTVSETEWGLHVETGLKEQESYHSYAVVPYAAMITIQRYKYN